ncbi:MAG: HAD family hydrolase [Thermoplasmata archaeon]
MSKINYSKLNLIVLDYDRTVTDMDLNFDQKILEPVSKLREIGVKIAIVTGREWSSMAKLKGFFDAIAYENGALIYANERKYKYYSVKNDEIRELLLSHGVKYTAGEVIISISMLDFERHKTMLEKYKNVEYIKNIGSVMILPEGINKGSALQKLLMLLNLNENYSVAIGDGENDTEMFKQARYKVCLENSVQVLKDISDLCIDKKASEGVFEFLKTVLSERGVSK